MKRFELGLIGFPLGHSFSRDYWQVKFRKEGIQNVGYSLFPVPEISGFRDLLAGHPDLIGLNVTIPYKEAIISYLDELSVEAEVIGAVNTISIHQKDGHRYLAGHNTDAAGFLKSFEPHLEGHHKSALILGTGGGAKAVKYALQQLDIPSTFVSRNPGNEDLSYDQVDEVVMQQHQIIVNATPLGMFGALERFSPYIPYDHLTQEHLLFDLVYNPSETHFLKLGKKQGARTVNGLGMLYAQADVAWKIWRKLIPDQSQ